MKNLALAFKIFFRILGDGQLAQRLRPLVEEPAEDTASTPATEPPGREALDSSEAAAATRSEALTLLATLQREARLLDFLMEPLDAYSDAQVGAAARDVQRDSGEVVRRLFAPAPLRGEAEGTSLEIAAGFDPVELRLTGQVGGTGPHHGTLRHHGWKATRQEIPAWSGSPDTASVLAPAEVEVG